jgi:hypothetical protein
MDAPDRLSMLHPAGLAAVAGEVGCFASADGVSGATVSLDAGALASSAARAAIMIRWIIRSREA